MTLYLFIGLALSAVLLPFQYFIGHDGVWYARMAENIFSGGGISVNAGEPYTGHPPFYPILMGLANFIFRDIEFSGHLVSLVAFALTVIPLFRITRAIYPPAAAHWVSLLYVTNGFLLIHSNLVMSESLLVLFMMLQLYFAHSIIQGKHRRVSTGAILGIVSGMAYLTRPEGLLFYLAGVVSILFLFPRQWAFKIRVVLLSLATFLVFALPYVGFIYKHTHRFQMTTEVPRLFILRQMGVSNPNQWLEVKKTFWGLSEDKTKLKGDELAEKFNLFHYLKKDHFVLLRSLPPSALNRFLNLSKYLFGGFGFFLIGASFFGAPWGGRRKQSEALFLLFLLTFLPQLIGFFLPKRYLLIFPILIIWMGNGVEVFRNWAKQSFGLSQKGSLGVALGACLLLALPSGWYLHRTLNLPPVFNESKELGLWIEKNIQQPRKKRVAAFLPAVNFYSGTKFVWLPYVKNLEDLKIYLSHQGTRYVVVSEDFDQPFLDAYRSLLDVTHEPPKGFVRRHIAGSSRKMIFYEVPN